MSGRLINSILNLFLIYPHRREQRKVDVGGIQTHGVRIDGTPISISLSILTFLPTCNLMRIAENMCVISMVGAYKRAPYKAEIKLTSSVNMTQVTEKDEKKFLGNIILNEKQCNFPHI